jgi:Na+/melibiose symporter-like transporter
VGFALGAYLSNSYVTNQQIRMIFAVHFALAVPTLLLMLSFRAKAVPAVVMAAMKEKNQEMRQKKKLQGIAGVVVAAGGPRISRRVWDTIYSSQTSLIFFLMVFLIGVSSGIVENFAYVRVADVGKASGVEAKFGVLRLASSAVGAPFFWLSGPLTAFLGMQGVFALSLLSYIARFLIYATMRVPMHALPAEMLRGATFALFWSGATQYASSIAPPGLSATIVSSEPMLLYCV